MQDLTQLERDVLSLDIRSRGRLAARLLESLDDVSDDEIGQLWAEEAARRNEEMEAGLDPGIPAEEVFRRLRSRR
jgi:putative addiction module component (TIGR02574 family)